ncbi:MAG: hypothetical protein NTU76_00070, partial [Candidatus Taylorbacteria bacterium]|nr:hypothetical protein [Candidatus Taylorbacteria bacterium]
WGCKIIILLFINFNFMKINFTKKQYLQLLKMAYLGNWMINAQREKTIKEYDEVERYIFSFAKEFGYNEYADEKNFPTKQFEETDVTDFQEEYDNETFWEELIRHFSTRDLEQTHGDEAIGKMSIEEFFKRYNMIEEKYANEFKKHGIERLGILK